MTVLSLYVRPKQFDVLGNVELGAPHIGDAVLDVVEEALRHGGVLVQVHQMRCLGEGKY